MRTIWLLAGLAGLAACGAPANTSDTPDSDDDTSYSQCDQWMIQGALSNMLDDQELDDWRNDPSNAREVRVMLHLNEPSRDTVEFRAQVECAASYAAARGSSARAVTDTMAIESIILRGNLPATEELCSAEMVKACWFGSVEKRCQLYNESECLAHPACWELRGPRLSEDWTCMEKDKFASCMGGLGMGLDWEVPVRGPAGRCWYFGYEPVGHPQISYDKTCPDQETALRKPECG